MEEEPSIAENSNKTTLRDVGRGFILLGSAILVLTVLFFFMSIWEQEYYGLFSGRTHLVFDTLIGLVLLIVGLVLVKYKTVKSEHSVSQE